MSDTPPLFEVPASPPLRAPRQLTNGAGPVTYGKYRPLHPVKCDDCLLVALEANRAGVGAPLARTARFVRKQDKVARYLCAEHKHLREEAEAEAARLSAARDLLA